MTFVAKPLVNARGAINALSGRVFYGWWIVMAGMVSSVVTVGISVHSLTAFFNPIAEDMGWSATKLSLAFSIRGVEAGIVGAFAGFIIEKIGARKVAIIGAILMALGFLIISGTRSLLVFYGGFMVLSVAQSASTMAPYTTTIVHWFRKKRGKALSLYLISTSAGALLVYPATVLIVAYGWRPALVVFAGLALFIGVPAALFLKSKPEDYGQVPDGEVSVQGTDSVAGSKDGEEAPSFTSLQAIRTRTFWMLVTAFGLLNLGLVSYTIFVMPHMLAEGYSKATAAILTTVWGVGNVIARLAIAGIVDKINKAIMYSVGLVLLGGSLLAFAFVSNAALIPLYLVALCAGQSIGVIMHQSIVADYFGPKHFASIQGMTSGILVGLSVAGPLLGGILFDSTGSYQWMFVIYGALVVVAAPLTFLAPRPIRRPVAVPATA